MAEIKNDQKMLNGGIDSDTANELLSSNKIRYALNCIVSSSSEGEEGVVTNLLGNILISTPLPDGENKTIGAVSDEESNRFFYAVWNSNGFHTWFQYNSVSNTITRLIQSKTDSNGEDIFNWLKEDIILGVNIVDGNKLYWTVYGSDHPARKINIDKIINREDPGYNDIIQSSYTLAYKEPPVYSPSVVYFTNSSLKSNNVYGNLFKFATRYIYDDYEFSSFSDFSTVAVPDEEDVTGTKGVPLINNGIRVSFLTGNPLVRKIELVMKKTDQNVNGEFAETDWVSLVVLDKDSLGISDDSEYQYDFYNDHSYISINQEEVVMPYSELPDYPKTQEYSGNVLFYANFKSGFPVVKPDIDISVVYEDLFVPDSTENVPNSPSFIYNQLDVYYESGGFANKGWRFKKGELIVGPDVKAGNIFYFTIDKGSGDVSTFTKKASLNDTASTIVSYFQGVLMASDQATKSGGYVGQVQPAGGGAFKFEFNMWNNAGRPYIEFSTDVTPVNYSKLKDTGNSVKNEKLGSAFRYGVIYEAADTSKKTLVYIDPDKLVSISNLSDLGAIKKASTLLNINHKAPYWAKRYQIVRTKNLIKRDYIQILVQAKSTVTDADSNAMYQDLSIGSLFTYQKIHANTSIKYSFEKGDRVRLLKTYSDATDSWTIETNVIDYEVIDYFDVVTDDIEANASIDGTTKVKVGGTTDSNNIGSYIRVNNTERLIVDVESDGYIVEYPFTEEDSNTTSARTYPGFQIINRRGVIRIKENSDYPIDIINGEKYALVEVYKPAQSFENTENENYYEIGYKFDIIEENGQFFHRGNIQDQTSSSPAIVKVEGFDNYVRNRQLPTNNSVKNTQMIFTSIEDRSFSDFYVSNLSSYGRVNRLDDSRGVIEFKESIIHSENRIEGTKVNGLSMFRNINRRDYNDKYGSIERLMFHDSILYVLRNLKIGYLPVNASIITDTGGISGILSAADQVIPKRINYVSWEDGVGKNPESAFRWGDDLWMMCPNSGVILRVTGGSSQAVSTPLKIDKEVRDKVTSASISGAKIFGSFDPHLKYCVWNIEGYETPVFIDSWYQNNSAIVPVVPIGDWSIVSAPTNGNASLTGNTIVYYPNVGFSGMDYLSYRTLNGIVRNVAVNVLSVDTQLTWVATGQYCVSSGGSRTGDVGFLTLSEYDNISQTLTGNVKPNAPGDPDYVAPYQDLDVCSIGLDYSRIGILSAEKNNQSISFTFVSEDDINIQIRSGSSFSGSLIQETGVVASGTYTLNAPISTGEYSIFVISPTANYDGISVLNIDGAYFKSASFADLVGLVELSLDQSSIPQSHNIAFTSLNISLNLLLTKIEVIHHKLSSVNLTPNNLLNHIDLSYGDNLISVTIGSWSILKVLKIHEIGATKVGYTPAFINSIINSFNAVVPSSSTGYTLQYGLNSSSGVKPSESVLSAYNSLISKGATVIGKSPEVINTSNLTVQCDPVGDTVAIALTLTNVLPVDVLVRVRGSYTAAGVNRDFIKNITIFSGNLNAYDEYSVGDPVTAATGLAQSVTPNPAGGITIIY